MSTFDKDSFLNQSYDSGSTVNLVVPEGEYDFLMDDRNPGDWFRSGEYVDKKTNEKKTWVRFEPLCSCQDPAMKALFARDLVLVPYDGGFSDFTPDGKLDMADGKNVKLNQMREALGQNEKGRAWNPGMMKKAGPFRGVVRHETGEDKVTRHKITRVVLKT